MAPIVITAMAWLTAALLAPIQQIPSPTSPFGAWPELPRQLRSEAELRAILETKPSDLAPYLELASLYYKDGRIEDGVQVLRRALPVHTETGAVYAAMVVLYGGPVNLDHHERIAEIAEEWVKADPTNPKPLVLLGRVHLFRATAARSQASDALTHLDRAKQVLDDAVQLSPTDPMPHALRLGVAKQRLGMTEVPAEQARLRHEIEVASEEFNRIAKVSGSRVATEALAISKESRPAPSNFPHAVRVGGNIKAPTKIKDVKPEFPPEAIQARVQGVVIFELTIDEAGKVAEARVLRSIPLLDRAAQDAVLQWEFTPTLLNGSPVPVIFTATVQFTLAPSQ